MKYMLHELDWITLLNAIVGGIFHKNAKKRILNFYELILLIKRQRFLLRYLQTLRCSRFSTTNNPVLLLHQNMLFYE